MKYPKVAENFRKILSLRGLSAQELADKAGIGKSSISHYVNGSHCPSTQRAQELADIMKCNPVWLMGLDDEMEKDVDEEETKELLKLFQGASEEMRSAALAVLKSGQRKA